ncbi:hypothetical protein [Streptomyces physcomitrii]|uniref:Uncharacterized protein n=1 Tax=Streptomyces physcomitrii TaxID=2724184 RepID=A0ABX1H3F9_9ACTN|nr:hypothetical protein [Streptomyces physcomitrii]NKI42896.1 hypothetical protein [Streptomyces physcomitrii]
MKYMRAELYSGGGWQPLQLVRKQETEDPLITFAEVSAADTSGKTAVEADIAKLLHQVNGLDPLTPLTVAFRDGTTVATTAVSLGHLRVGVRRELDT